MWRESDDGTLTCTCPTCGWSRHLNADAQGLAGPVHVLTHMRRCRATVTDEEREADRTALRDDIEIDGA
jgi:hypothetical protein